MDLCGPDTLTLGEILQRILAVTGRTRFRMRIPLPLARFQAVVLERVYPTLLGQAPAYPDGINGTFELAIDLPFFKDVDREYARVVAGGVKPIYAPRDEPWGMREFGVRTIDGHRMMFGQAVD